MKFSTRKTHFFLQLRAWNYIEEPWFVFPALYPAIAEKNARESVATLSIWSRNVTTSAPINVVRMAQFVLKIAIACRFLGPETLPGTSRNYFPGRIFQRRSRNYFPGRLFQTRSRNHFPGRIEFSKFRTDESKGKAKVHYWKSIYHQVSSFFLLRRICV